MYNAQLTYDRIDEMAKLRGISIGKINEMCSLSKNANFKCCQKVNLV